MATWSVVLVLLFSAAVATATEYLDNSIPDDPESTRIAVIKSQREDESDRRVFVFHFNSCYGKPSCNDDGNCSTSEFCDNLNELFQRPCCKNQKASGVCSRDRECVGGHCSGGSCSECNEDDHCAPDKFCRHMKIPLAIKKCETKLHDEMTCNRDSMCVSGKCVDFVCCMRCSNKAIEVKGKCVHDENCPSDQYCKLEKLLIKDVPTKSRGRGKKAFMLGYRCAPMKPIGSLCVRDTQCLNGFCATGRCSHCVTDAQCHDDQYCKHRNSIPFFVRSCERKKSTGFCTRPGQCQSGKCIYARCLKP